MFTLCSVVRSVRVRRSLGVFLISVVVTLVCARSSSSGSGRTLHLVVVCSLVASLRSVGDERSQHARPGKNLPRHNHPHRHTGRCGFTRDEKCQVQCTRITSSRPENSVTSTCSQHGIPTALSQAHFLKPCQKAFAEISPTVSERYTHSHATRSPPLGLCCCCSNSRHAARPFAVLYASDKICATLWINVCMCYMLSVHITRRQVSGASQRQSVFQARRVPGAFQKGSMSVRQFVLTACPRAVAKRPNCNFTHMCSRYFTQHCWNDGQQCVSENEIQHGRSIMAARATQTCSKQCVGCKLCGSLGSERRERCGKLTITVIESSFEVNKCKFLALLLQDPNFDVLHRGWRLFSQ